MAEDAPSSLEPLRFPPVPLVSGTGVEGRDRGTSLQEVTAVAVVITAVDGTQHVVDLEYRYGGWWPPRDG